MKYFATIDADGRRTGTYLPNDPDIPSDAFEIDEATFQEWIADDTTRRWSNGRLVECDPPIHVPTWAEIRAKRDRLLYDCDWVALRAIDAGEPVPPEWLAYRKVLRDIPQTYDDPTLVTWPLEPERP